MSDNRTDDNKGDPAPIADLLANVYSKQQWKKQWRLFNLVRQWPTIVGREVGQLTMPAFFRQDTLWIYVQDSAWMHHLQFIKLDLLTRINRALGEQPVTDIRWQLQPQLPTLSKRQAPAPHAVNPENERSFQQMTASIDNEECREALQRLWRHFAAHSD
ncbi:MAG: DciA family protein [Desulfobulbus sp.]